MSVCEWKEGSVVDIQLFGRINELIDGRRMHEDYGVSFCFWVHYKTQPADCQVPDSQLSDLHFPGREHLDQFIFNP